MSCWWTNLQSDWNRASSDMVFEILDDLQNAEGKTIIMVEQNAKKGLEFRRYRLCPGFW